MAAWCPTKSSWRALNLEVVGSGGEVVTVPRRNTQNDTTAVRPPPISVEALFSTLCCGQRGIPNQLAQLLYSRPRKTDKSDRDDDTVQTAAAVRPNSISDMRAFFHYTSFVYALFFPSGVFHSTIRMM